MPAHKHQTWRSRPIFLSSTFRDMHAERDYLRTHVFSELEERLRERSHYLETIDLRQGVETAGERDVGQREMKVLRVCLDEIDRCKPFFVGLIGDRYGWIPPAERMQAAAERIQFADERTGFTASVAGRSVTELEFLYGVLENSDQRTRSRFYIRELDYTGMPEELLALYDDRRAGDAEAPQRVAALEALKQRLREELPDRVRTYRARWDPEQGRVVGLEELARLVLDDLWSDLDAATRDAVQEAPKTWQEAERRELDEFTDERTDPRSYVARPGVTRPIVDHLVSPRHDGESWGLCLTGEAGSGKSSLFGEIYRELRGRDDVLVLAHAAGISPRSVRVDAMLHRWVRELAENLGIEDPLATPETTTTDTTPTDPRSTDRPMGSQSKQVEETFAELLAAAAEQRRVVVLIDALNQFERTTRGQYITWLPPAWPANARLVGTAIPGVESKALLERDGMRELAVPALERGEAEEIALGFYKERHHRQMNSAVLGILLDKGSSEPKSRPACSNPLWLMLALQEMNLLDADDFERAEREFADLPPGERMARLQSSEAAQLPAGVTGIYGRLLKRAESDLGREWVQSFVNVIALGRSGWRESDLRALMPRISQQPWDDLAFAGVRRTLGRHIAQRGERAAQWDFFHTQLRVTVLDRNLSDQSERRRLHGLLIDHLQALPPDDALRVSESMVHAIGLGDRPRAAEYLAGLEIGGEERAGAVSVLAAGIETKQMAGDGVALGDWVEGLLGVSNVVPDQRVSVARLLLFGLSDVLLVGREAEEERRRLHHATTAELEALVSEVADAPRRWVRDLSVSYNKLGDLYRGLGEGTRALEYYRKALEIVEELRRRNPQSADCARDLSVSYNKLGDLYRGLGERRKALEYYQKALGLREDLRRRSPQSADYARGLSISYERMGDLYRGQGEGTKALEYHRKALGLREELRRRSPQSADYARLLSVSYNKLGDLYRGQGEGTKVLECYRKALEIVEELRRRNPQSADCARLLSVSYIKLGDLHRSLGEGTKALEYYRKALEFREELRRRNPQSANYARDLSVSCERMGDLYLGLGEGTKALEYYRKALEIAEELRRRNPQSAEYSRDLSVSYDRMGDLYLGLGEGPKALEYYRKALEIAEELRRRNPQSADYARDLSVSYDRMGDLYRGLGEGPKALEYYRKALELREELRRRNPQSAEYSRDLSVSYNKLGDLYLGLGEGPKALEYYRKALEIAEELRRRNPQSADYARDLSVSYERMGDLYRGLGEGPKALEYYRKALELREELRRRNPQSADYTRDLAFSHGKLGEFFAQSDRNRAVTRFEKARLLLEQLDEEGRLPDEKARQVLDHIRKRLRELCVD